MANRTIKRRNRYARFSGSTARFHTDNVALVGKISLSNAVISTGRGPDSQKMAEYYLRVHSYDEALPKTIGLTGPMKEIVDNYDRIIGETPKEMRVRLHQDEAGTLDMFFAGTQFFFVDVNIQKKMIRRSQIYPSRAMAMAMLTNHAVTWVEQLPRRSP